MARSQLRAQLLSAPDDMVRDTAALTRDEHGMRNQAAVPGRLSAKELMESNEAPPVDGTRRSTRRSVRSIGVTTWSRGRLPTAFSQRFALSQTRLTGVESAPTIDRRCGI